MAIKPLIPITHPLIRTELPEFQFIRKEDGLTNAVDYAYELVENMVHYDGIGLAANQIGDPYRVFCVASNPVLVCFNPFIADFSSEMVTLEEGCLTYPGLIVKVTRPKSIKIRFIQPNGEARNESYTGMTARIMQHELEHLNGKRFFDNVDWWEKEKVKKWFKKHQKKK